MTPARRPRARAREHTSSRPPLVIAHRGDSSRCPENTLAAFASAAAAGADGIELDVRLSSDGVVVVCHDATLARFGGGVRALGSRSCHELTHADVGSWFAPRYAHERIPTLAAVLKRFPRLVFIELKPPGGRGARVQARRLVAAVVQVVARARAAARVRLLCFSPGVLTELRRLAPGLPRVRNLERAPVAPAAWLARQPGLQALCVDQRILSAELAAAVRARGLALYAYSCNTSAQLAAARPHRLTALLTDRPAWLVARLGRGRRTGAGQ